MGYINKVSGLVLAGLMMLGGAASAATIGFTTVNAPQAAPLTFSNGTESVKVTASRVNAAGHQIGGTALIASYGSHNGGLGVCTSGKSRYGIGGCAFGDSHLVDGANFFSSRPEMAFIDFGSIVVDLVSITFNYVNDGDTFKLLSNLFPQTSQTIASGNFQQTFTLTSALRGSVFGIGAGGKHDDFKIKSIAYHVVETPVSPVPLPAAGFLLFGAVAGAAALRRRKA